MAEESKAGKNDFAWALLIVFIILALLLAASVWFPYYPQGGTPDEVTIHTFSSFSGSAGALGYTENYVSRVQNFGDFGVGVPQEEELESAPMMEISAGLLSGEKETFDIEVPEYVQDYAKGGTITFTVTESNQYGDLVMKWNGDEVYRAKSSAGDHEVELEASQVKGQNTLEVYADGPGIMFWAATVYQIKDFSVKASYGPAKFVSFEVSQDELATLDHFELAWYTKSRRGNLSVTVNGEEIYNGYPDRDVSITFSDSSLGTSMIRAGNNRMMFSAVNATDSFELSDVLINTHVSRSQRTVREKVTVTKAQLDRINAQGGSLMLYVSRIEKAGKIALKINEQSSGSVDGKTGWNEIALKKDLLREGENWFEVSGTGAFTITEAKVEMS